MEHLEELLPLPIKQITHRDVSLLLSVLPLTFSTALHQITVL